MARHPRELTDTCHQLGSGVLVTLSDKPLSGLCDGVLGIQTGAGAAERAPSGCNISCLDP
jgi:hypothetical protein